MFAAQMPGVRHILALIAAVMLVLGGAPSWAAPAPCNPCPPDCPMMMAQAHMSGPVAHGQHAPAKGKTGNPCKEGLACQATAVAPVFSGGSAVVILTTDEAETYALPTQGGPSRPPDPGLRPPRQL